jgi:hypothetical protein
LNPQDLAMGCRNKAATPEGTSKAKAVSFKGVVWARWLLSHVESILRRCEILITNNINRYDIT